MTRPSDMAVSGRAGEERSGVWVALAARKRFVFLVFFVWRPKEAAARCTPADPAGRRQRSALLAHMTAYFFSGGVTALLSKPLLQRKEIHPSRLTQPGVERGAGAGCSPFVVVTGLRLSIFPAGPGKSWGMRA